MNKVYLILLFSTLTCCTLQFNNIAVAIHEFQSSSSAPAITTIPGADSFTIQQPEVQITSHTSGQTVPVGPLTISGTSSDTPLRECQVYVDLDDKMPFQRVVAIGPGGPNDYSQWTFTYNSSYQLIHNGINNLTSKIVCIDSPATAKWYSINLIGISNSPSSPSPPIGLPLPVPDQVNVIPSPLDPVFEVEGEEESDDDWENLFDNNNGEDEEEIETSDEEDEEEDEQEDDDNGSRERCPNGSHMSPSGDCERVRDLPDNLPRCPNGSHRSPDGDCERVRD